MPDAASLAPLLESGQYDQYMKELMAQTYGSAGVSPYMRNTMMKRAPDIARQAQMSAVINAQTPDINAMTDPSVVANAMAQAMNNARVGGPSSNMPNPQDTGMKFLERLAQMSQEDPSSPGAMLAEVVYNDPKLMQSLVMSSMPDNYGGVFGPGLKNQMKDRMYEQYYRTPETGNYFNDLRNMMAGFTGASRVEPAFVTEGSQHNPAQAVINEISGTETPMSVEDKAALLAELTALSN